MDRDDDDPEEITDASTSHGVVSDIDRKRIIKAYLAGKQAKVIAEIMDLPQRKVGIIIRNYSKTGRILPAGKSMTPQRTEKKKLDESQIDILRIWASEDATQTHATLAQRFNETFNLNITVNAIPQLLGPFIFSIRRLKPPPEITNDARTLNLRKEYCQIYSELPSMYDDADVTYIGQMRFRMAFRDRENRGRVRLRNISICVAFNKLNVVQYMGQDEPVTKEVFQEFLLTTIDDLTERNQLNGVFIMEETNSPEESDRLNELIQSKGYTMIYLPPSSPFLNPTEVLFNELKELLTNSASQTELNESFLVDMITNGSPLLDNMECGRYVESVMPFVPRCLNSETIETASVYSIFAEACDNDDDKTTEDIQILYTSV